MNKAINTCKNVAKLFSKLTALKTIALWINSDKVTIENKKMTIWKGSKKLFGSASSSSKKLKLKNVKKLSFNLFESNNFSKTILKNKNKKIPVTQLFAKDIFSTACN